MMRRATHKGACKNSLKYRKNNNNAIMMISTIVISLCSSLYHHVDAFAPLTPFTSFTKQQGIIIAPTPVLKLQLNKQRSPHYYTCLSAYHSNEEEAEGGEAVVEEGMEVDIQVQGPKQRKRELIRDLIFRQRNSNNHHRLKKKLVTLSTSIAIYTTILFKSPQISKADHPFFNDSSTSKISLRPGMSIDQFESELEKQRDGMTVEEKIENQLANPSNAINDDNHNVEETLQQQQQKKTVKKNKEFDFDDEYDFDDDEEEDDDKNETIMKNQLNSSKAAAISSSKSLSSYEGAINLSASNAAETVTKFSGSAPVMSSSKKNVEIGKTVTKIVGPIFAVCFTRETIRWNREQRNVDKGIEIMEQQRQEYLKNKNNGDEDDDDDDDDDDDEDDEDDDDEDDEDDDDEDDDEDENYRKR